MAKDEQIYVAGYRQGYWVGFDSGKEWAFKAQKRYNEAARAWEERGCNPDGTPKIDKEKNNV